MYEPPKFPYPACAYPSDADLPVSIDQAVPKLEEPQIAGLNGWMLADAPYWSVLSAHAPSK